MQQRTLSLKCRVSSGTWRSKDKERRTDPSWLPENDDGGNERAEARVCWLAVLLPLGQSHSGGRQRGALCPFKFSEVLLSDFVFATRSKYFVQTASSGAP